MSGSSSMSAGEHGITEQSVSALLNEALNSFPEPPLPDGPIAPSIHTVLAHAHLTGIWGGAIALGVPVPVASSLTSGLLAIPADKISAVERADVVGELVNLIAGNLK